MYINRLKRTYGLDDVNPQQYFQLKAGINDIWGQVNTLEKPHQEKLFSLAEKIIREMFNVPDSLQLQINPDEFGMVGGTNVLDEYKQSFNEYYFEDYSGMQQANESIDRSRMNYCMVCGGAGDAMKAYRNWENELDTIDYRLHGMYDKINSFNDFNLWVSPDDVLVENIDDSSSFKVMDYGNGYTIIIDAPNFLSALYESAKAVLSILFQEKYNNPHVDYDSPWNNRIGSMLWPKFSQHASKNKNFPYVIDAVHDLDDEDYAYVMREVFAGTNHSKKIFEELHNSLIVP